VLVTIRQLIDEGMTSVLVTHEMAFAREIAQQVYFTDYGLIVEDGPPAQLFGNPRKERTRAFLEQIL
jgi:polar amino acid transport system ATP-binding protein